MDRLDAPALTREEDDEALSQKPESVGLGHERPDEAEEPQKCVAQEERHGPGGIAHNGCIEVVVGEVLHRSAASSPLPACWRTEKR